MDKQALHVSLREFETRLTVKLNKSLWRFCGFTLIGAAVINGLFFSILLHLIK